MYVSLTHIPSPVVMQDTATLNQLWIRIIDMILSGNAYILFGSIFLCARMKPGVGYKNALLYATVFCYVTAFTNFVAAWCIYHNVYRLIAIVQPFATAVKIAFVLYCWSNFANFVVTLRRSEFGDSVLNEMNKNEQQRKINLEVTNKIIKERSETMLSRLSRNTSDASTNHNPHAELGRVSG